MRHITTLAGILPLFFLAPAAYASVEGGGAPPINVGSFLLTPKLIVEQQYNSNIYATEDDEEGDFISVARPSIGIEKSVRDHQFNLTAETEILRYWENSSENQVNGNAQFDARLTALRGLFLPFKLSYGVDHRQRNRERSVVQADEPLRYKTFDTEAGVEYQPNRFFLGLYGRYTNRRYDNGTTATGVPVIREDGDNDTYGGRVSVRYDAPREWQPFASLSVNHSDYERRSFDGASFSGVARDNTVYRALAGLAFKYKGLLSGNFALGRDRRDYTDDTISDVSATAAEAFIEWNPTEKTALSLTVSRSTEEDNEINAGLIDTKAGLLLNHELQSDLFLQARTQYENENFESSSREDHYYEGSLGIYYALSPRLQIGTDLVQRMRDSNREDASFDQTAIMFRLTGAL